MVRVSSAKEASIVSAFALNATQLTPPLERGAAEAHEMHSHTRSEADAASAVSHMLQILRATVLPFTRRRLAWCETRFVYVGSYFRAFGDNLAKEKHDGITSPLLCSGK
jgi:hypothetical protein